MQIDPIAHIQTPFKEKFAIPRQPQLASAASGEIVFTPAFADINALRGIEAFSHLWLFFSFHQNLEKGWSPLVRPPRLGGNKKQGVFATRSSFRPNGLGLSLVTNLGAVQNGKDVILQVGGVDLVDGTPIFDIKPYLPYVDSVPEAAAGFAQGAPAAQLSVTFSCQSRQTLEHLKTQHPSLPLLIEQVLCQDPRPAYQKDDPERVYGVRLYDFDVRFAVVGQDCNVIEIKPADS